MILCCIVTWSISCAGNNERKARNTRDIFNYTRLSNLQLHYSQDYINPTNDDVSNSKDGSDELKLATEAKMAANATVTHRQKANTIKHMQNVHWCHALLKFGEVTYVGCATTVWFEDQLLRNDYIVVLLVGFCERFLCLVVWFLSQCPWFIFLTDNSYCINNNETSREWRSSRQETFSQRVQSHSTTTFGCTLKETLD